MSGYRELPPAYRRPPPTRAARVGTEVARRSHAAVPVTVVLVLAGLVLSSYTLLVPGLLGVVLLLAGGSFLSTRLNPLSPHFYLTRKPSWAAIGVVFLGALALLGESYALWRQGAGHLLPHL